MGACATKPKVKGDEGAIPAPEHVEDAVKNTKEVKVMEEEKEVIEKVDVGDEKSQSPAFLLAVKEATPMVEVSSLTKAEEKSKADPEVAPETGNVSAKDMKKSEEKATEKKDE